MAQNKNKKKKKPAKQPATVHLNAHGKPASAGVSKYLDTPRPELERKRDEGKRILSELEALEKNPDVFSPGDGALLDASALPEGIAELLSGELKEGEELESLSYQDLRLKVRHVFRMSNAALEFISIKSEKALVQELLKAPGALGDLVAPLSGAGSSLLSPCSIFGILNKKNP